MLQQSWLPKWHSIKTSHHSLNTVLSHWDHITRDLLPPSVQKACNSLLPSLQHKKGPKQLGFQELGCFLHYSYRSLSGSPQHGVKSYFGLVSVYDWCEGIGSMCMTWMFTAFWCGPAHVLICHLGVLWRAVFLLFSEHCVAIRQTSKPTA